VPLDIMKGATRTPEFLAKNPGGRIPLLEWPDGRCLAESNAILFHLAEGTPLLPDSSWERADVLRWLFFEQNLHEPYIAVARFWHHSGKLEENRPALPDKLRRGNEALGVMERQLRSHAFFSGERYTIADIALYAYTHVAPEGGFDLGPFPAVSHWLARVRSQPRYIAITDEVGKLARWP
jgi:glutathione S-transferase